MSYNIDKAFEQLNEVKETPSYLPAGIQENLLLTGFRHETSKNGKNFVEFKFERDGQQVTHTEWEPRDENVEKLTSKQLNQLVRTIRILACFYDKVRLHKGDLRFTGDSFSEYATWVENLLKPELNGETKTPLRAKIIYNDDGYTALPKKHWETFIEPMTVTETKIKKEANDRFERPVIADKEKPVDPLSAASLGASTTVEIDNNEDGLPF